MALLLIMLSGAVIFVFGIAAQLALWAYARSELLSQMDLVGATRLVLNSFAGYWDHPYLAYFIWWFWLPLCWIGISLHFRWPSEEDYAIRFLASFITGWLFIGLVVLILVVMLLAGEIVLQRSILQPPMLVRWIPTITIILPLGLLAAWLRMWYRARNHTR
jgi:hypothetical protein